MPFEALEQVEPEVKVESKSKGRFVPLEDQSPETYKAHQIMQDRKQDNADFTKRTTLTMEGLIASSARKSLGPMGISKILGMVETAEFETDKFVKDAKREVEKKTGTISAGTMGMVSGTGGMVKWLGESLITSEDQKKALRDKGYTEDAIWRSDELPKRLIQWGDFVKGKFGESAAYYQSNLPQYEEGFLQDPSLSRATDIMAGAIPSLGAAIALGIVSGGTSLLPMLFLSGVQAESVYSDARDAGRDVQDSTTLGLTVGTGVFIIEKMLGPLDDFFGGGTGNKIANMLKLGSKEGLLAEPSQQILENMVRRFGLDETWGLMTNVVESAIGGFGSMFALAGFTPNSTKRITQDMQNLKDKGLTDNDIKLATEVATELMVAKNQEIDNVIKTDADAFIKKQEQIELEETKGIEYVQPERAIREGDALIKVNIEALEQSFKKDEGFYIGEKGKDGIGQRYENFQNFLKTGEKIETPEISVNSKGEITFTNGRHRFAVIRDMGAKTIEISVPKDQVDQFSKFTRKPTPIPKFKSKEKIQTFEELKIESLERVENLSQTAEFYSQEEVDQLNKQIDIDFEAEVRRLHNEGKEIPLDIMERFNLKETDPLIEEAKKYESADELKYKLYDDLAQQQRGKPEEAMLDIQKTKVSDLYGYVVEHGGDLTHRINESINMFHGAYAKSKIKNLLSTLTEEYGFEKEVNEQIESNFNYYKKQGTQKYKSIEEARASLKEASQKYADEHKKLPAYNEAQETSKDIAVALGEWRFDDAIKGLEKLQSHIDKGTWDTFIEEGKNVEDIWNKAQEGKPKPKVKKEPAYKRASKLIQDMKKKLSSGEVKSLTELKADKKQLIKELWFSHAIPKKTMQNIVGEINKIRNVEKFNKYVDEINDRILAVGKLRDTIKAKKFKKLDNFRKYLKFPTMANMTTKQLQQFEKALEPYQKEDVFLTPRQLETVDKTDLKGIRTIREAKVKLAETMGVDVKSLDKIKVSELDRFRYDTALAEKNPFYKLMVEETNRQLLIAEAEALTTENEINELTKKARASRKKSFLDKAIPSDDMVFQYLESAKKAELIPEMTVEEVELAQHLEQKFAEALEYLIQTEALKTGRDNYITNIRRDFFEAAKADGFVQAFKEVFEQYRLDEQKFDILDQATSQILPLDKFFQFSLQRTGGMKPTTNVAKASTVYFRTLAKKKALDALIPTLDIYVDVLTPTTKTRTGLETDRKLKNFFREWMNTKKGRPFHAFVKPGGKIDLGIKGANAFVSIMDLGLNIPVGVAAQVGESVASYVNLGAKNTVKGATRMNTKKGKRITDKYKEFVGKSVWAEMTEPGNNMGDKFSMSLFALFKDSSVKANKLHLLGAMTDAEYTSETISNERLAEIKVEMGRYRGIPGAKSIAGATAEGGIATKYKTWAIPIMRTMSNNITELASKVSKGQFKDAVQSRSARELKSAAEITLAALLMGSFIDEDDNSFLGQLLAKAKRESLTILGALDPEMFTSEPRLLAWAASLSKALKELITLEKYKEEKMKGKLKGVERIKRDFTPRAIKTFTKDDKKKIQP